MDGAKGEGESALTPALSQGGEGGKTKGEDAGFRFNVSGVDGQRVLIWRVGMFDEDRNCQITPSANPTYWLGKGLDLHGKLQPNALQYGLKSGKARIALAG